VSDSTETMEPPTKREPAASLTQHIEQNVEDVVALQRQQWERASTSQRRVERLSTFIGRPVFLVTLLLLVIFWVGGNMTATSLGWNAVDPWPFALLDGVLTLVALMVTTVVLIAQNRQARLEQQHTHLGLQVTLLTEQKVTKLIHLLEELREDLPMVRSRRDPQTEIMKETADASEVISTIEEEVKGVEEGKPRSAKTAGPATGGANGQ
jgi:uncharacterized membrane protein